MDHFLFRTAVTTTGQFAPPDIPWESHALPEIDGPAPVGVWGTDGASLDHDPMLAGMHVDPVIPGF